MKNLKKILVMTVIMTMAALPVTAVRAAAASVDIPMTTLGISHLGDLTLVLKEGVPQTIIVRGHDVSGMGIGFSVNGASYMGDVMLSNNLTLIPATMPLMFEHYGVVEFTFGADMLVLKYNGTASKTKDLAMLTKTLYSKGDFTVAAATGVFAGLKDVKGTYKLTEVCHIVPGMHPMVGSPVEVMFSAMGM
jgi:hypothetical protein